MVDGTNLTVNVRTRLVWNIARRYTVIAQTRQPIRSLKILTKLVLNSFICTCSPLVRLSRAPPSHVANTRSLSSVRGTLFINLSSISLSISLSISISVCLYSIASLYLSHSLSIACLSLSLSLYLCFASSNASLRSIFLSCDQPSS